MRRQRHIGVEVFGKSRKWKEARKTERKKNSKKNKKKRIVMSNI